MPDTTSHEPKDFKAIMLSSTFTDLKEHRQRAIDIMQRMGYLARVMEHSGAQAEADVIDTSLAMVRDAVAYIGVISHKYGQTPFDAQRNPHQLSITELEYNEALRLSRPIVLFIMSDEHLIRKADIEWNAKRRKKLDQFRERSKRVRVDGQVQRVYETFDSVEQFSIAAAVAIANLIRYIERPPPPKKARVSYRSSRPISNIPINIPFHFFGRDASLEAIDRILNTAEQRSTMAVLNGPRGVGKTTLAAAYAELHREDYRAVRWVKAENESMMRADLMGLGVQLGWVAPDAAEQEAMGAVIERLAVEGDGILLIYDNAPGPSDLGQFMPRETAAQIIVTSNAPNWETEGAVIELEVWPKTVGANYLMARTGRATEREAALALSEVLGGLPLAHEQVAAHCERAGISLAEYSALLKDASSNLAIAKPDAIREQEPLPTISGSLGLAIDEAAKRHRAAEPLLVYAALLAPGPIPLFLLSEGRSKFAEPLRPLIEGDGLSEAIAILDMFALIARESIQDERDASITTPCIRLHPLVRQAAAARCSDAELPLRKKELIEALVGVYPDQAFSDPKVWPRARRLDAAVLDIVTGDTASLPDKALRSVSVLIDRLAAYRTAVLGRPGTSGGLTEIGPLLEKALEIDEKTLGPEHPNTIASINNLGIFRHRYGMGGEQALFERALRICKSNWGLDDPRSVPSLSNLGALLCDQGEFAAARPHLERAFLIRQSNLGPDHPETAVSMYHLARLVRAEGELARAKQLLDHAVLVFEGSKALIHVAAAAAELASVTVELGDPETASRLYLHALKIREKLYGAEHEETQEVATEAARLLDQLNPRRAKTLRKKHGITTQADGGPR